MVGEGSGGEGGGIMVLHGAELSRSSRALGCFVNPKQVFFTVYIHAYSDLHICHLHTPR